MNPGYLLSLSMLFLSGCSVNPATQIKAFSDATVSVTENVDMVIGEFNHAALERQYTDFAASYNGKFATKLTGKALSEIKEPLTPARKKQLAIYQANRALGNYATALGKLSSTDVRHEIDQATADLHGAITSLDTQYHAVYPDTKPLLAPDNLALFSGLLAAMGNSIVEEKRRKAIKEVVQQADPAVSLICDMLAEQLGSAGIEQGIASSRQYVLAEEILDYKSRVKSDTTLEWRRNEIKRLHKLQQQVNTAKLLVQKTRRAIRTVKKSHNILAKEVSRDVFSSAAITSTIGQLKDMSRHYSDVETLLLECHKLSRDNNGRLSCDD